MLLRVQARLDAGEDTTAISERIRGDAAIYNANCNLVRAERVATIARVQAVGTIGHAVKVPWAAAGGYGTPTTAFAAATAGTNDANPTNASLIVNGAITNVGFFGAASRITEARYNADFDNDGAITGNEVVGVLEMADAIGVETPETTNQPPLMIAEPNDNLDNFAVGQRLYVNNTESCWRIA